MTCPTRLGVNVDTPPNGDATNRSWLDLLDTAVAMGIGLVRISWEIDWDPTPGASWPAILGAIHDRGLAVIDGVQGMPAAWSSTGQAGHYWPSWPTGVQAYAAHLAWRSSLLAAGDALRRSATSGTTRRAWHPASRRIRPTPRRCAPSPGPPAVPEVRR